MAELVPRRHSGVTLEEGDPHNNAVCSESPAHQRKKTCRKRKRSMNTDTPPAEPIPELSDEIVLDILVRLPVKSLLRCKSVCKGWRAIITDPFFVRTHLQRSTSRCEPDPCLIITPLPIGWHVGSNHLRFYQWQQGVSMATLIHDQNFGSEFRYTRCLAQCDGLVLVIAFFRLYLINPATRETVALPDRDCNWHCCYVGLGLDPRTGKHKVVRGFSRHGSIRLNTCKGTGMGMEVFTVSSNSNGDDSAWREIEDDLPYPAQDWSTGTMVNGFLFWPPARNHRDQGLLRLSLADETFGVTRLPDSVDPAPPFGLDVLHGVLCMSASTCNDTVTMWMLPIKEDGGQGQTWEQRYTVHLTCVYRPLAFLPGGRLMLHIGKNVCLYDMSTANLTTVCQLDHMKYQGVRAQTLKKVTFNVHLYTESLVRISA